MPPSNWQPIQLGELGRLRNGVNFSREQEGLGLPVLKVKDFGDLVLCPLNGLDELDPTAFSVPDDQLLADNDVVIIRSNGNPELVGRSVLVHGVSRPTTFSGFCIRFRTDAARADARFLAYYLRSPICRARMTRFGSGTGIQNLNQSILTELPLDLPPLTEQRAIASALGSLDTKIEQNRRTSRALERLARAIFKAWFVDFEPVKAKAAGARSFPGMPPNAFAVLPTSFVDSELGPIPKGWKTGMVSDAAELSKVQVKPQEAAEEVFDHFSIPAFDDGQTAAIEAGSAIKSNKFLVIENCVLVSKLNPRIPRTWLPPAANKRRQIASTEFLVTVPHGGWSRDYLYCQFQQDEFRDSLTQGASGTSNSHQRARPQDFLAKNIVIPPALLRAEFQSIVGPMMNLRATQHAESRKLAEMRDYLLPKLLSGEVRVTEIEQRLKKRL
jgi:type I restriction enzyme S subunit